MNPKPGEVWLVDLGLAAKTRPIVIVSRYDPDPPRALVLYIPVTTHNPGSALSLNYLFCLSSGKVLLQMFKAWVLFPL